MNLNKLHVKHVLTHSLCERIAASLNPLVADVMALYIKTKNYHWHLYGPHFRDYHLLFDEQAAQILEMVDVLAERVRKLGQPTITSIGHIARIKTLQDDDSLPKDAHKMLESLVHDNLHLSVSLRAAHKVCEEAQDFATTSLIEVFLDETERRIWFLNSMMV
jgi:starvation-inducible DNA-binding protein